MRKRKVRMRERDCPCDNGDNKPHLARCPWFDLERAKWAMFIQNAPDEYLRLAHMDPNDYAEDRRLGH